MAESPFRKAALQQLADLLLPTIPESFQDLGQRAAGRAEVLATLGTGMAGSIPAGYGGLLELARTGDPSTAADLTRQIQEGLTYMPRTEMGQEYLQDLSGPLEMLAAPSEAIGQATLEATGSPLAAAGAETFGDPLEYLLPGLKGVMATAPLARRAMRASDGAMKASDIGVNVPDEVLDQVAQEKIIAFHGSPYEFEKFDMSQIGTGEGAQAYGYGLYFAEAEDVASDYRKRLTPRAPVTMPDGREILRSDQLDFADEIDASFSAVDQAIMRIGLEGSIEEAKNTATNLIPELEKAFPREAQRLRDELKFYDIAEEKISVGEKPKGATYRVEIDAKPEELLDWDKPIDKDQMKRLADAGIVERIPSKFEGVDLRELLIDHGENVNPNYRYSIGEDGIRASSPEEAIATVSTEPYYSIGGTGSRGSMTGETLYNALSRKPGEDPAKVSEKLNKAGIKGIRYLDGMSRNKEGGTSNFVVFDDRLIKIAEKYGVALPVAGAILYQLEQQSQPIESI